MKNSTKILFVLSLVLAVVFSVASCDENNDKGCGAGKHTWSENYTKLTEASCDKSATGYRVCTVCQEKSRVGEIPDTLLAHKWSDTYTIETAAACEKNATGYKICSVCNAHSKTEELTDTALEHVWSEDYTEAAPAACGVNKTQHKTCTRDGCGAHDTAVEVEGTALSHEWSKDYTTATPATCTENKWAYKVCTLCDTPNKKVELDGTALGHTMSAEYTTDKAATCTENRWAHKTCTVCDAPGTSVEIENTATGHSFPEGNAINLYKIDTPANCGVNATGHKVCAACGGADKTVQIAGTALSHDYNGEAVKDEFKIANTDHEYYKSCINCGEKDPDNATFVADCTFDQEIIIDSPSNFAAEKNTEHPDLYYSSCKCGTVSDSVTFGVGYPEFGHGLGVLYNDDKANAGSRYDYDVKEGFAAQSAAKAYQNVKFNTITDNEEKFSVAVLNTATSPWQPNYTPTDGTLKNSTFAFETDIYFSDFTVTTTDYQLAFLGFGNLGSNSSNTYMFAHLYLMISPTEAKTVDYLYFKEAKDVKFEPEKWYNLRLVVKDDPEDDGYKSLIDIYINGYIAAKDIKASYGTPKPENAQITNNNTLTGFSWQFRYSPAGPGQKPTDEDGSTTVILDNTYIGIPHGDTHVFNQEIMSEKTFKSHKNTTTPEAYYKSCVCGEISDTEVFYVGVPESETGTGVYYNKVDAVGIKYSFGDEAFDLESAVSLKSWALDDSGLSGKLSVTENKLVASFKQPVTSSWGLWYLANDAEANKGTKHIFETDIKFGNITASAGTRVGIFGMYNTKNYNEQKGASNGFFHCYLVAATDENGKTSIALSRKDGGTDGNFVTFNEGEEYNLRIETTEVEGVSLEVVVYVNDHPVLTATQNDTDLCHILSYKDNGEITIYADSTFGGIGFENSNKQGSSFDITFFNTYLGSE